MAGRHNTLRESPADAKFQLCVVEFNVPGAPNGGTDKGPNGHRIDSIPIANSVIAAGGACKIVKYSHDKHDEFASETAGMDALIVRINPGQLSQGTPEGTQKRFDALMNQYIAGGKLVWSSPKVQTQMGAKDALCKINTLGCGLIDTYAYYTAEELENGFKKCCAYQPRVIKQNRGSAGEGIWLCWLSRGLSAEDGIVPLGEYPAKTFGEVSLKDTDTLKLMEMNDNHVEYHTVKEFLTFCVGGPNAEGAGKWSSSFPGKYLEGGKEAGGQLVDQRLLPRINEGEVRILMAGDTCQMAIHKKPTGGGLSAVGGNSEYTYYKPTDDKYKAMIESLYRDIPTLMPMMGLGDEPLPLLWTADYIPKNPEGWSKAENASDAETEYVVGEFNCSCVGISKFQAVCGGEKTLADVPDEDYFDAIELTNLMGVKAIEMLQAATSSRSLPTPALQSSEPVIVVDVSVSTSLSPLQQWSITGNFNGFYDLVGFPQAPNSFDGDGVTPGCSRTTFGFGPSDPMSDVLRAYDAQKMSMTTEMTSIPSAFPMNKCIVSWTVSPSSDGKAVVSVHTEMTFTGSVGKGGGMPGAGEPPFATYDGMESFWRGAYHGWIHAAEQIALTNAETAAQGQAAQATQAAEDAQAAQAAQEVAGNAPAADKVEATGVTEEIPLLPPEPVVADDAPPEECGGAMMSAKLAAAVRQAGAYLAANDQAREDRFMAKLKMKECKTAAAAALEKAQKAWQALTKAQEHARECEQAYDKAVADEPLAAKALDDAREAKAAAEAAYSAADDAEKKEKVKAKKAEKKKETEEKKKLLADASKEEKLAEKNVEAAAVAVEEKEAANDKAKDELEKAQEKHTLDLGISNKKKEEEEAAARYIEQLAEEDRQKELREQRLQEAIEKDALLGD